MWSRASRIASRKRSTSCLGRIALGAVAITLVAGIHQIS
jgi:hypothetical protein